MGRPSGGSGVSFGYIAITVLNYVLRPVLAKWHSMLLEYENARDARLSPIAHEDQWTKADDLRKALNDIRSQLVDFANLLAEAAKVPPLHR